MAISYDKLFNLLDEKGITTYYLRQNKIMGQQTYYNLKNSKGNLGTETLEKLCNLLNCQPGDIMEYIPEKGNDTIPNPGHAVRVQNKSQGSESAVLPKPSEKSREEVRASSASSIRKQKKYYKPLTENEKNQIDLARLLSDVIYQVEIADIYGIEILSLLMKEAGQQQTKDKNEQQNEEMTRNHNDT